MVAPPNAPDSGFITYQHSSGLFSIRIPPQWVADELPDSGGGIRVQFSNLEGTQSITRLTIYIVNTGVTMNREAFLQTAQQYQPPADLAIYDWQLLHAPVDLADGSRRIAGIRFYPTLGSRILNIFMQGDAIYFSALELDVTDANEALLDTLTAVVNTYRVNANVTLPQGEITGITSSSGTVSFSDYVAWTDRDGGFNITGRLTNNDQEALEALVLTGYLFDIRDNQLTEKTSILPINYLEAGASTFFRLRFEGGRPSTAVRYELHVAARNTRSVPASFYDTENFEIAQNEAYYNDSGNLVLSGTLVNRGNRLVRDVQLVISITDSANRVIAVQTQNINKDQLLPNEADTYEVIVYDIGGAPDFYELQVIGVAE